MLSAAAVVPEGLQYDDRVLKLSSDSAGPQHDEAKAGHWQRGVRDLPTAPGNTVSRAIMHKSVYAGSRLATSCYTITLANTGQSI
jgi:hypothetical protein